MSVAAPRTLADKIWQAHVVAELDARTSLLHVDRLFMHDRTGGRMLKGVRDAGRRIHSPGLVFGTFDHVVDTFEGRGDRAAKIKGGVEFIHAFKDEAARAGLPLIGLDDPSQGIVHVIAPELGVAVPGATIACGDSHTCTLGGMGALAWGIGVTDGEHVLSTQTMRQARRRNMRVRFDGRMGEGVSAKDLVLALIGRHGAAGGAGHVVEFAGPAVRALGVAGRLTLCNMAVEFGAWTGIVGPDETTFDYLFGRPFAPSGRDWEAAVAHWRGLASDNEAVFDTEYVLDASAIAPQVTWGTSPQHVVGVDGRVPDPAWTEDGSARASMEKALAYAGLTPGQPLDAVKIGAAFIGSCTNARIEDLRAAAAILQGRKVAPGVTALCVPGSTPVKRAAEAEGLDRIFRAAGFEWREAGCSLCFYGGGDSFGAARRVISSTNRNFEGRQGPGVRTHLASPATVAASAIAGHIADPRRL
jgi:3-isopropylmalate/(R)-2-methylmalate dehydratase large subunit